MNLLDIFVVAIILICGIVAYRKGFIKSCLGFVPTVAALLAGKFISPVFSKFIRQTPFFTMFQEKISTAMGLESIITKHAMNTQNEIISSMKLPSFIEHALLENNNPVIYRILDVESIQEYISSFLANVCVNIISVIVVFIVAFLIAKIALGALNLFAQLPVLSFVNKLGGLIVGTAQGVIFVWIAGIAFTFFYYKPQMTAIVQMLNSQGPAGWLYNNNMLLYLILEIFT